MTHNSPARARSTRTRVVQWFAYLCFLVVVTGGLAEIIGRQIWRSDGNGLYWRKFELFVFDPQLNYVLKPGFNIDGNDNRLYPGVGIRINRIGLRSGELDGLPKILVLGDSVVFGFGVDATHIMTTRLEALLGGKYQVINAGVPGYNFEQIELMAQRLIARINPIAIVVVVNANDLQPRYYITHGGATVARFRAYPWEESLLDESPVTHDAYDKSILAAGFNRFRVLDFPRSPDRLEKNTRAVLDAERRILGHHHSGDAKIQARIQSAIASTRRLAEGTTARGAKIVFAFFPWRVNVIDTAEEDKILQNWISSVPVGPSTSSVDLLPLLREAEKNGPQFLVADEHPNEHGHEIIATALAAALRGTGIR